MRIPREHVLGPGDAFHMMWRCHNKERLLDSHAEKREYLKAVHNDYLAHCSSEDFLIHVYCAMSNHFHARKSIVENLSAYSEHMRRAHGRFGQAYNRRHERLGKVAHDRPKTLRIQDERAAMRVDFYILSNPIRAGLIRDPRDFRWKDLYPYRFYAYGEDNRFSDMLTLPDWYLDLGETPKLRQRRFRSLFDRYLVDQGLRPDPRMRTGHFIGADWWRLEMRRQLRQQLQLGSCAGAPEPIDSS